jgi:hypothetical protein
MRVKDPLFALSRRLQHPRPEGANLCAWRNASYFILFFIVFTIQTFCKALFGGGALLK